MVDKHILALGLRLLSDRMAAAGAVAASFLSSVIMCVCMWTGNNQTRLKAVI